MQAKNISGVSFFKAFLLEAARAEIGRIQMGTAEINMGTIALPTVEPIFSLSLSPKNFARGELARRKTRMNKLSLIFLARMRRRSLSLFPCLF
jgi:hypothetical protein